MRMMPTSVAQRNRGEDARIAVRRLNHMMKHSVNAQKDTTSDAMLHR